MQLLEPVTHRSDRYGWAGWIHWETSGAHSHAWKQPQLFFSVDVHTCKVFDESTAVAFTRDFFNARPVVAKSFWPVPVPRRRSGWKPPGYRRSGAPSGSPTSTADAEVSIGQS